MIPIIIPSYQRPTTQHTMRLLASAGIPFKVVLHTDKERAAYIEQDITATGNYIVSHAAPGLVNQRNFILDEMAGWGDWIIMLDDNIRRFTAVPDSHYGRETLPKEKPILKLYETDCPPGRFTELSQDMATLADEVGAFHAGYGTTNNAYFRTKKLRYVGLCMGKMTMTRKTWTRYDPNIPIMSDFDFTGASLLETGRVLINNYIHAVSKHYESGGEGVFSKRIAKKITSAAALVEKYRGLYRYQDRANSAAGAELRMRFTSLKQVEAWRQSYQVEQYG